MKSEEEEEEKEEEERDGTADEEVVVVVLFVVLLLLRNGVDRVTDAADLIGSGAEVLWKVDEIGTGSGGNSSLVRRSFIVMSHAKNSNDSNTIAWWERGVWLIGWR